MIMKSADKIFIGIFVMLINNVYADNQFHNLKYTSQADVTSLFMSVVNKPSACTGYFFMKQLDLFKQPLIEEEKLLRKKFNHHLDKKPVLTQELVKRLFDYDDGKLLWKERTGGQIRIGDSAGMIIKLEKGDRVKIKINRKYYRRSRLVFLWHYGYEPEMVDHIDGNTLNDKIENLRAATHTENNRNRISKISKASKFKGVIKTPGGKWAVYLKTNGKRIYIGTFIQENDAAKAYNQKAIEFFGEFANLNIFES